MAPVALRLFGPVIERNQCGRKRWGHGPESSSVIGAFACNVGDEQTVVAWVLGFLLSWSMDEAGVSGNVRLGRPFGMVQEHPCGFWLRCPFPVHLGAEPAVGKPFFPRLTPSSRLKKRPVLPLEPAPCGERETGERRPNPPRRRHDHLQSDHQPDDAAHPRSR